MCYNISKYPLPFLTPYPLSSSNCSSLFYLFLFFPRFFFLVPPPARGYNPRMHLFTHTQQQRMRSEAPLAARMRPAS
jgi:hypothetical protein